jgi:hypothetical protein
MGPPPIQLCTVAGVSTALQLLNTYTTLYSLPVVTKQIAKYFARYGYTFRRNVYLFLFGGVGLNPH